MEIFTSALNSLIGNLGKAATVSIGPFLIAILVSLVPIAVMGFGGQLLGTGFVDFADMASAGISTALIVALVLVLIAIWVVAFTVVAIGWHRSVLEGHPVSLFPKLSGMPIRPYIGRLLVLGLILLAIFVGFVIVVAVLTFAFSQLGTIGFIGIALMSVAVFAFVTALWYRMASTLPAIALGLVPPIGAGFDQTSSIKRQILWTAVASIIFNVVVGLPSNILGATLSGIYDLVVTWFTVMLGLSILTEIYRRTGHTPNVTEVFD